MKFILERVSNKLKGWKLKCLSQAGKEVLIKAVVQAIPSFTMSCFSLPIYFWKKINALVRSFWWNNSKDNGRLLLEKMERQRCVVGASNLKTVRISI